MEQFSCGDECNRTANFYEALRCYYEVLGLAGVEKDPLPPLRLQAQLH
jgi:hypothetical protein